MATILIVDDEKIERDGIKLLIEKFKCDLHVIEAENGEKALEGLTYIADDAGLQIRR
jgi:two-component system response regulator YesN